MESAKKSLLGQFKNIPLKQYRYESKRFPCPISKPQKN